ncbi:16S rRNA (uracil(1498)-N(3))-methyltransferase [Chromatium okenii]|uniref:Ribosomal RNA small subunit methyltransferase E n=1 Tax=Chromatium okenii TaxID=61644 RepID=A0A2S7XN80_9GAMM|nr:16S rRNA (uracil(1498)-N(3))-methyltransferase [Chromatium okenii]MBV5310585.1 16S rRNA (uracil(1498)-N(3))-methyltransferase [Chromatium okenii]PQJ94882.1 16S rRNA (uracil(1498)-N(3))-methyltransferase [Chromatium okenii]
MRHTRIFVDLPLAVGDAVTLPPGATRHVTQVLRLAADAPLILFNGDGCDYPARLLTSHRATATALIQDVTAPEPPMPLAIHLALGVSKGERMEYALQKAVELGVSRLTPLFTERSQVRLEGERLARRLEHWRGVVIGACEQSGRRRLPLLDPALALESWLAEWTAGGVLLDPEAAQALINLPAPNGEITLLIGPEGGLSASERQQVKKQGFQGVRLGSRILRTETAPLAAIAVIQALWGDFK